MNSDTPIDIIYLFRHSKHGDEELRFSLRSVARSLPWILEQDQEPRRRQVEGDALADV